MVHAHDNYRFRQTVRSTPLRSRHEALCQLEASEVHHFLPSALLLLTAGTTTFFGPTVLRKVACIFFVYALSVLLVPNGEYTPAPLVRRDAKAVLAELNVQIFRFRAIDLEGLIAALELPPVMTAEQGTKFTAHEGILILLLRFALRAILLPESAIRLVLNSLKCLECLTSWSYGSAVVGATC